MSGGKSHGPSKHHNPHAHVIHQPGRRLMHGITLKFVQNKVSGGHKKATNAGLNLVSFIDFLITTVIFLLMSFSASGEITVDKNVKLPKAENVEDIIDAPMVAVNGNQILVDGVLAGRCDEATRLRDWPVALAIATSSRPGVAAMAGRCWSRAILPRPTRARRRLIFFSLPLGGAAIGVVPDRIAPAKALLAVA